MKLLFASLLLTSISAFAMPVNHSAYLASTTLISSTSSSFLELPQTRNRKGSHRVGGRNSHGKGSRYKGGR